MKIKFTAYLDDGEEQEMEIPAKYEVCERCRGTGKHDHPAFENGFTRDDDFVDDDFIEEYMAGTYDVKCEECKGERVVLVPDRKRCNPVNLAIYYRQQMEIEDMKAMERAERRAGA